MLHHSFYVLSFETFLVSASSKHCSIIQGTAKILNEEQPFENKHSHLL